jgi:uncharacterized membrane protein SpoIIM required for sporulation
MVVHEFIRTRQDDWERLQGFLETVRRLSLARLPLDVFRDGTALYRQAVADLAFARMSFPGHPVVGQLERLVGHAHSLLYQAGSADSRSWKEFWRDTWPDRVREAARPILLATALFWAGTLLGFLLTARNPVLEMYFVSPSMRAAIVSKHLWTESITRTAPTAGSAIMTNNIKVSLLTWGLGLTFGVGTFWLLVFNGLMLGAIAAACLRAGMLGPLAAFVVGHGSLELPAIWISGGAGFLMSQALLFPGRYNRRAELRLKGRQSVEIIVGTVPMLLVAGTIEAFVSPSEIPVIAKALLGLSLAVALTGFIVARGSVRSGPQDEKPALQA